MSTLFLSYARSDDEPFVKRLYDDLSAHGFDIWWDRVSMPGRALTFLQEIRDAITARDRLVFVVSPKAVTSDYVRAEWLYALEIGKAINPVLRLGDYDLLPDELKLLDAPDLRDDGALRGPAGNAGAPALRAGRADGQADRGAVVAAALPAAPGSPPRAQGRRASRPASAGGHHGHGRAHGHPRHGRDRQVGPGLRPGATTRCVGRFPTAYSGWASGSSRR